MEQKEKSAQELRALEQVKRAQAHLAKVRREEKAKARKEQDHQKFIMGGIIVKYFLEAYEFTEQEMCRIIACAFKNYLDKTLLIKEFLDRKAYVSFF